MHNRMMITGAGSGLGREIALRWAREGWQLALSDVNEGGLAETLKMVREAGGDGFTMRCDVRDYSQLIAFAQACEEKAALMQAPGMSNYNVAKAGVVALSESLLVELRQAEVGVHVVCPSFFQTNLLDSFRGPTPNVKAQIGKLLESSPITAADIADYIHQQVAKGEFMILPHDEGRMAWKVKQQNPQAIYDEMALLAEKKRAKSKAL